MSESEIKFMYSSVIRQGVKVKINHYLSPCHFKKSERTITYQKVCRFFYEFLFYIIHISYNNQLGVPTYNNLFKAI